MMKKGSDPFSHRHNLQLGWALGYFGMPHILVRFMAISSEKRGKKSRVIGCMVCYITFCFACFIAIVGRAYLVPALANNKSENVFIEMIQKVFNSDIGLPFVGGIFLCGILAAIMSTADSQLLVTASSVSEDIYHSCIAPKAESKKVLLVSRITVLAVAVVAYIIALDPNSSIMGLVSNAWAGTWSFVWSDNTYVPLLEENKPRRCGGRRCQRCVVGNNMGLHTAYKRTDFR